MTVASTMRRPPSPWRAPPTAAKPSGITRGTRRRSLPTAIFWATTWLSPRSATTSTAPGHTRRQKKARTIWASARERNCAWAARILISTKQLAVSSQPSPGRCSPVFPSPAESAANDGFNDQVVRRPGDSPADTKVEFPFRRDIQVNGGKELLLLVGYRIKAADRAKRAVVFQSGAEGLGEIVRHFDIGRELKAQVDVFSVE